MISRTTIGKNFRGVVRYQFSGRRDAPTDKQPEVLVAVGVRETSADEMLEDFNRRRRQNDDLGKAVWHTTLSFNPADAARLDSAQMLRIAERWVQEMKLDQTQYVIIRHHDQADNQHVHLVANRVDNAGQTISDKHNFFAARRVNKLLEAEFELTPARGSSQPELQHPERIDGPDRSRAKIRQAIGRALAEGVTERGELLAVLRTQHITAREFTTKTGVVTGISFAKDDHTFKGSEVARDYGLAGLEKQLARNREAQAAQQQAALAAEQQAAAHRQEAARAAEQQAQEAAHRREAAGQETRLALTQTRDAGLSDPAQFFDRLRAQPYDLLRDAQTQQLTHVRHRGSGEVFAWAEVQPGGPGAPPLADQLLVAVEQTRQQEAQAEAARVAQQLAERQRQLEEQQRQAAEQAEATLQTKLRTHLLASLARQVPTATSLSELQANGEREGLRVRAVWQADGQLQDVFFTNTAYPGREVRGQELAPAYAADMLSRQLAQQATQRVVEEQAAQAALAGLRQEQAAIEVLKRAADQAERVGDYVQAAALLYGSLPEAQQRLAAYQAQAAATPSGRAWLAEEQAQAQAQRQAVEQGRLAAQAHAHALAQEQEQLRLAELAHLREQRAAKAAVAGMQQEQRFLEASTRAAAQAEEQGDYGKVAELRYGLIPAAEQRRAAYQAQAEASPVGRTLLHEWQERETAAQRAGDLLGESAKKPGFVTLEEFNQQARPTGYQLASFAVGQPQRVVEVSSGRELELSPSASQLLTDTLTESIRKEQGLRAHQQTERQALAAAQAQYENRGLEVVRVLVPPAQVKAVIQGVGTGSIVGQSTGADGLVRLNIVYNPNAMTWTLTKALEEVRARGGEVLERPEKAARREQSTRAEYARAIPTQGLSQQNEM